jgi:hypothetical protein
MPASNIWSKFPLLRAKVVVTGALLVLALGAHAQFFKWARQHNPNYDERFISYGFMIGLHTSAYQLQYSDRFVTQDFDTVHSVITPFLPGFSLGFLVNMSLNSDLDLRLMPKAGFYNHRVEYRYTNRTVKEQLVETTLMEFPLLLKYKSARRGNVRMYMVGGVTPAFELSGQNDAQSGTTGLDIRKQNLSLDAGIGFDFYFPMFKFSQEIRFSRGISNMLGASPSPFTEPIRRLNTNTISVYFIFQ